MASESYNYSVQLVFDSNILVDALIPGRPYSHSVVALLDMVRAGKIEGWYASHCLAIVYDLVEKAIFSETGNRVKAVESAQKLVKEQLGFLKPLPQVGDELLHLNIQAKEDIEALLMVSLAQDYLPNPLFVTCNQWFFKKERYPAAHPDDILKNRSFIEGKGWKRAVRFIDLDEQQRKIRPQIQANINKVLKHGQYILGPEIKELEDKLASFVQVDHCITCSSGTDALLISLMSLDIGPGDEVITVPYTWISTAEVIALLGAKPVFVDILPDTFNMDPDQIKNAITSKTRAIMPVSIYGQCADMSRINDVAKKHGIPVIEDGAQSFGATHYGNKSCGLSTIGCTSFFPSKPLGCYGDGGAIFTSDNNLADKMRRIRVHGQKKKHQHPLVGINGRMDTIQAAILLEKLKLFENECRLRREVADRYNCLLADFSDIQVPVVAEGNESVYAQYTICTKNRDRISAKLKAGKIPSVAYYVTPLHLQGAFRNLGTNEGDFPVTERIASRCLSLPMYPYLSENQQETIAKVIRNMVTII